MTDIITVYGVRDYAGEKTIWSRTRVEAEAVAKNQGNRRRNPNIQEAQMPEDIFHSLAEWDG